jgi:hypothetical protein
MEFHEIEVDEISRNSMEFHGSPWKSMNSWNFMKFGFDRENFMEIHRIPWKSMNS